MFFLRRRLRLFFTGCILLSLIVTGVIFVAKLLSDTSSSTAVADRLLPLRSGGLHGDTNEEITSAQNALFHQVLQEVRNSPIDAEKIVESIEFLNRNQEVLNVEKFGVVKNSTVSFVVVVQVHKRLGYLLYLVNSLRAVKGIEKALLVFSHDLNDEAINTLVRSITFCRVIQVFYPYNIQIFPNMFPGYDPRDCPATMTKAEAESAKCKNWRYPDKYGHYRLASLAQIKHHWWWKMNYVFDDVIKKYELETFVVLLEEDHYVAPDFLYTLNEMVVRRASICPECNVLSLGAYLKNYKTYMKDLSTLGVQPWYSSKHNMGMALGSATWEEMRNCSELFCTFDDYNWDWSLLKVSLSCLRKKLVVLFAKSPRVLHIGDCGVHAHRCEPHNAVASAEELFKKYAEHFFPAKMVLSGVTKRMYKPPKPNGGWGDVRDQALCRMNTKVYAGHPSDKSNCTDSSATLTFNSILSLV